MQAASHLYMLPELLPSILLSGRHPSIHYSTNRFLFTISFSFADRNTANLQLAYTFNNTGKLTKTTMAIKNTVGQTYMTADNHLELFSEESVLKMVQNNPVKCTLEPFRRDTEAKRKTIIWLDCSESLRRRSTGKKRLVRDVWVKTASQIILSYHTLALSF